jgi:hypothetical protein
VRGNENGHYSSTTSIRNLCMSAALPVQLTCSAQLTLGIPVYKNRVRHFKLMYLHLLVGPKKDRGHAVA